MIRKKILVGVLCISVLVLSGCGGKASDNKSESATAESISDNSEKTDSMVNDSSKLNGKEESGMETNSAKTQNQDDNTSFDKSSDNSQDSQIDEVGIESVSTVEPLNMEEDDLVFSDLLSQIGVPLTDARSALEMAEDSNEKSGLLFGETVTITLKSNEDLCTAMQVAFLGTPKDSLENAISEQLGDDGKVVEDGTLWLTEEGFVLLYESAEGCYVDIGLE